MFNSTMTLSSNVNYLHRSIGFQLRNLWRIRQFMNTRSRLQPPRSSVTHHFSLRKLQWTFYYIIRPRTQKIATPTESARSILAVGR